LLIPAGILAFPENVVSNGWRVYYYNSSVLVSIMNDLKRMRDCEISNKKARRLRFKTLPSTIFRAFRGFVRGNKAMQEEKSNQENLSVVCFDEIFQIPFNLVPTTKGLYFR
jgi:hypothetical protein